MENMAYVRYQPLTSLNAHHAGKLAGTPAQHPVKSLLITFMHTPRRSIVSRSALVASLLSLQDQAIAQWVYGISAL